MATIIIMIAIILLTLFAVWIGYEIAHPADEECHNCHRHCKCAHEMERELEEQKQTPSLRGTTKE